MSDPIVCQDGCFLKLNKNYLVLVEDDRKYSKMISKIFNKQLYFFGASLFSCKLIDMTSIMGSKRSTIALYLSFCGLPTFVNAVYSATEIQETLHDLDMKYTQQYLNSI